MNGQRLRNTRAASLAEAEKPERAIRREERKRVCVLPFSLYTGVPEDDGVLFRHMAPATYYCKTLSIYLNATDGIRMQLGVDNTEFIERDLVSGMNVFQVERIVPVGTRITMKITEGSARGAWAAWTGEVDA